MRVRTVAEVRGTALVSNPASGCPAWAVGWTEGCVESRYQKMVGARRAIGEKQRWGEVPEGSLGPNDAPMEDIAATVEVVERKEGCLVDGMSRPGRAGSS